MDPFTFGFLRLTSFFLRLLSTLTRIRFAVAQARPKAFSSFLSHTIILITSLLHIFVCFTCLFPYSRSFRFIPPTSLFCESLSEHRSQSFSVTRPFAYVRMFSYILGCLSCILMRFPSSPSHSFIRKIFQA